MMCAPRNEEQVYHAEHTITSGLLTSVLQVDFWFLSFFCHKVLISILADQIGTKLQRHNVQKCTRRSYNIVLDEMYPGPICLW
jgi:hypothetical protein